jgi:lipopolysaccharide assembly protein A
MRFIQAVVLLAFLVAVAVFAFQNTQVVTVQLFDRTVAAPVALTVVAVYLLGMLSGWTVVAFLGRSIRRVSETTH